MNVDLGSLKETLSAVNSAMRVNTVAEEMAHGERVAAAIARESAKRDATLAAGAEASIEQKEILQQQLEMIREQNMFLCDNYEKLKEMYDAQVQANIEAKTELDRSKRFNAWMMVIAIIAMLAAIAVPVTTILVSRQCYN